MPPSRASSLLLGGGGGGALFEASSSDVEDWVCIEAELLCWQAAEAQNEQHARRTSLPKLLNEVAQAQLQLDRHRRERDERNQELKAICCECEQHSRDIESSGARGVVAAVEDCRFSASFVAAQADLAVHQKEQATMLAVDARQRRRKLAGHQKELESAERELGDTEAQRRRELAELYAGAETRVKGLLETIRAACDSAGTSSCSSASSTAVAADWDTLQRHQAAATLQLQGLQEEITGALGMRLDAVRGDCERLSDRCSAIRAGMEAEQAVVDTLEAVSRKAEAASRAAREKCAATDKLLGEWSVNWAAHGCELGALTQDFDQRRATRAQLYKRRQQLASICADLEVNETELEREMAQKVRALQDNTFEAQRWGARLSELRKGYLQLPVGKLPYPPRGAIDPELVHRAIVANLGEDELRLVSEARVHVASQVALLKSEHKFTKYSLTRSIPADVRQRVLAYLQLTGLIRVMGTAPALRREAEERVARACENLVVTEDNLGCARPRAVSAKVGFNLRQAPAAARGTQAQSRLLSRVIAMLRTPFLLRQIRNMDLAEASIEFIRSEELQQAMAAMRVLESVRLPTRGWRDSTELHHFRERLETRSIQVSLH